MLFGINATPVVSRTHTPDDVVDFFSDTGTDTNILCASARKININVDENRAGS